MTSPSVVFTANRGYALTSSRTLLIQDFLSSGWEVVLATADDAESRSLCEMGAYLEMVVLRKSVIVKEEQIFLWDERTCGRRNGHKINKYQSKSIN